MRRRTRNKLSFLSMLMLVGVGAGIGVCLVQNNTQPPVKVQTEETISAETAPAQPSQSFNTETTNAVQRPNRSHETPQQEGTEYSAELLKEVRSENPEATFLNIEPILQDDFESGCEIYSAATMLHFYKMPVDEFDLVEKYVNFQPVYYGGDGGYYGPDLNSAFAGDADLGYGAYAPAMANAINRYFEDEQSDYRAVVVKDTTLNKLCREYIDNNCPLMVWITTDMEMPYDFVDWTVDYVDENALFEEGDTFSWPVNEHCMVLMGYDGDNYYFSDSLDATIVSYPAEQCERVFEAMGGQAVYVSKK